MESNLPKDIDITTFHGGLLKSALDKSKRWGMYDLWSNKLISGQKEWQPIAFDNVMKLLKDLEIRFKAKNREMSIDFKMPIPDYKGDLKFIIHFKEEYMVVYVEWPHTCPKSHVADMLEYINYVNSGLAAGHFYIDADSEMEFTDGEIELTKVCFKSMQLYSEVINYQVILCYWLIGMPMRVYEQYHQGLINIMAGKQSAEEAYEIAFDSKHSNLCDWYDETESPLMMYHFSEGKRKNNR